MRNVSSSSGYRSVNVCDFISKIDEFNNEIELIGKVNNLRRVSFFGYSKSTLSRLNFIPTSFHVGRQNRTELSPLARQQVKRREEFRILSYQSNNENRFVCKTQIIADKKLNLSSRRRFTCRREIYRTFFQT